MSSQIRPAILQMEPYSPGKPIEEVKRELGLDRVIKLASNENPLGPSPKALAVVREAAAHLHIYPDGAAFDVRAAISSRFQVEPAQILLGNGSDELIHLLGLILLEDSHDEVIVSETSFVRYDAAPQLANCKLIKVPMTGDWRHDLVAMAARITERTKLMFIANPNNPTGTIVSREEIRTLLETVGNRCIVVLDEAYCEFAEEDPNYATSLEFLADFPNVVGLRTFSKTYGLAGIRIGFGFGSPQVVDAVNRAREPFNTNSLAQVAAVAALQDEDHLRNTVENNRRGREILETALARHGATSVPGYANFVFADFGRPTRPIFDQLLRRGIIIRPGDIFGCPNHLRISIGTLEENQAFVEALDSVMAAV